ncbi:unnamed protein product [Orchesella dallaii]|uniref:DUF243 domain-containing protein n=1 Tax=Orchesella dallaii TaxID=48710 RepID=A0ABP1RE03_9HEXA
MGGDNYPITLKTDNTMGRYYVASRGIEPGELILQDDPIIVSPNTPIEPGSLTCVGCCGISQTSLPCGKCGWPVCKQECADIPDHAEFECKIFAKCQIKTPLPSPYCFIAEAEYIKVLRCLLLRELGKEDPAKLEKWNMLQELEAHIELRKMVPKLMFMSKLIRNFVQDFCKLTEFDENTIDHVLGAIDVNAFKNVTNPMLPAGTYGATNIHKNATVIYGKGSIVAHGCLRNTQSLTFPNGKLEMRAGTFIPEQEPITHAYVDLMLGTPERRKVIKEQFYFECTCSRCSDPTEGGTYISALKCTQCSNGYLLMDNPLDFCHYWKCNNCTEIQPTEYETELLAELRTEEKKILNSGRKNNAMIGSWIELLEKFSGKLHDNHYTLLQIQLHLIRCMAKVSKPPAELVEDMHKLVNRVSRTLNGFYHSEQTFSSGFISGQRSSSQHQSANCSLNSNFQVSENSQTLNLIQFFNMKFFIVLIATVAVVTAEGGYSGGGGGGGSFASIGGGFLSGGGSGLFGGSSGGGFSSGGGGFSSGGGGFSSGGGGGNGGGAGGQVHRHVYVHVAPDDPVDSQARVIRVPGGQDKHVNIIFVKAPSASSQQQTEVILPEQNEQKTLVYVLLKKGEANSDIKVRGPAPTRPTKPEVYFIRYKDQAAGGAGGGSSGGIGGLSGGIGGLSGGFGGSSFGGSSGSSFGSSRGVSTAYGAP